MSVIQSPTTCNTPKTFTPKFGKKSASSCSENVKKEMCVSTDNVFASHNLEVSLQNASGVPNLLCPSLFLTGFLF